MTWKVVSGSKAARGPPAAKVSIGRVNLNSATLAELGELPGTGPALVRPIMEARPLQSVGDLGRVMGIGAKRLEQLRPMVRVE